MARPIRETPILFGEDARRFEENMRNAKCTITRKEYEEMMASYRAVLAALERGDPRGLGDSGTSTIQK